MAAGAFSCRSCEQTKKPQVSGKNAVAQRYRGSHERHAKTKSHAVRSTASASAKVESIDIPESLRMKHNRGHVSE